MYKHLRGRHDQLDHGRKRGGSDDGSNANYSNAQQTNVLRRDDAKKRLQYIENAKNNSEAVNQIQGVLQKIRSPMPDAQLAESNTQIPKKAIEQLSKSAPGQELLREIVDELAKEESENPNTSSLSSDLWKFIKKILDKAGEEDEEDEEGNSQQARYLKDVVGLARKYGLSIPSKVSKRNIPYNLIRQLQSVAPIEYADIIRKYS